MALFVLEKQTKQDTSPPQWLRSKESICNAREAGDVEEEMAIHSSILAWKIPWTGKPGGLQSKGSQRIGHNGATTSRKQDISQLHLNCDFDIILGF